MVSTSQAPSVEVEGLIDGVVESAVILNPGLPAARLAELLLKETEPDVLAALSRTLLTRDFIARIRRLAAARRRLERDKQFTFAFPAFREYLAILPNRLREGSVQKTDYRDYITELNSRHRESQMNDRRRVAAQGILALWPKGRKNRGLTLAEVDTIKAKKAGLI